MKLLINLVLASSIFPRQLQCYVVTFNIEIGTSWSGTSRLDSDEQLSPPGVSARLGRAITRFRALSAL